MEKPYLISSNIERKFILLSICDQLCANTVRSIREDIVPLIQQFDVPVTLVVDLREASGNQLDALDELRVLWAQYEKTTIGQIVRIFANEMDDQGAKITDQFHLKSIRKINVTRMQQAIDYCESFVAG